MLVVRGLAIISIILTLQPLQARSFDLRPEGTEDERTISELAGGFFNRFRYTIADWAIEHFSNRVHEEVTNRIWGCTPLAPKDKNDTTCVRWDKTPAAIIYGVQWNDNPPFKLDETRSLTTCDLQTPIRLPDRQFDCWLLLFHDAGKRAAAGEVFTQENNYALLYRSHFGDLQFLHSMASWNGEWMSSTKTSIMMWAEFSYKVAIGEISPATNVSDVPVAGFNEVLGNYWGDISSLFTYGVGTYANEVDDVAFGSFLHMVQDSFSRSHVLREYPASTCGNGMGPDGGRIISFNAYSTQDSDDHEVEDTKEKMLLGVLQQPHGNVVLVGARLKQYRDEGAPWETVRAYLDSCVYYVKPSDNRKPANDGGFG